MANLTTIPLEDSFETSLTQELSAAGLTINVAGVPNFTFQSGETTYLTLSPGQTNMEVVDIESYDSSAKTITISASGRNQAQGDTVTTTAQVHTVGSKAIISDNYAFWNDIQTSVNTKIGTDADATLDANYDFTADSATTTFRTPNMTTTARDNIASPLNGMLIYNTTVGAQQVYDGGAWASLDTGAAIPNASETVAGAVELATNAEMGTGTTTGSTGARLVAPNDQLVKTSSGAGDENKIAVLNASGQLAAGFIDSSSVPSWLFGDGSSGALSVTSGTTNLTAGTIYNYSSGEISVGATLSSASTSGTILIKCNGNFNIDGTVDMSGKVTGAGSNVSIHLTTVTAPSLAAAGNGAAGANSGGAAGTAANGYGGGGGGGKTQTGGSGGAGGNGGTPGGAAGAAGAAPNGSGGGGGLSAGGGGGANSGDAGGAGGAAYGNDGAVGAESVGSGGGGAGGDIGLTGLNIVIQAASFSGSGTINVSGTAGGAAGDGGNGAVAGGTGGGGGGGGAGGNTGVAYLIANTAVFGGTVTATAGAGGAAGSGGTSGFGGGAGSGTAGTIGNVATNTNALLSTII